MFKHFIYLITAQTSGAAINVTNFQVCVLGYFCYSTELFTTSLHTLLLSFHFKPVKQAI